MHHPGLGPGGGAQPLVHLVRGERYAATVGLGLLAHRRPGIGVDDVGPLDRGPGIMAKLDPAAGGGRDGRYSLHDRPVGRVARGMGDPDVDALAGRDQGE
jgi:hypothetical protein